MSFIQATKSQNKKKTKLITCALHVIQLPANLEIRGIPLKLNNDKNSKHKHRARKIRPWRAWGILVQEQSDKITAIISSGICDFLNLQAMI